LNKIAISVGHEAKNYFNATFDNLNHRFFDFIQITFWASSEAQNELKVPCEPLTHRFFDLAQVAIWVGKDCK